MTTRLRKNRKKRGHVSAGHGRVGKHRKHPNGRGKAGGFHHMRTLMMKFHPGFLERKGSKNYHVAANTKFISTVNVDELWALVPEETRLHYKENPSKLPMIDCNKHGIFKVLGKGLPPVQKVAIRARWFSKKAVDKIEAAGGVAVIGN